MCCVRWVVIGFIMSFARVLQQLYIPMILLPDPHPRHSLLTRSLALLSPKTNLTMFFDYYAETPMASPLDPAVVTSLIIAKKSPSIMWFHKSACRLDQGRTTIFSICQQHQVRSQVSAEGEYNATPLCLGKAFSLAESTTKKTRKRLSRKPRRRRNPRK